jgi:small-conductance mechanosensitive channel
LISEEKTLAEIYVYVHHYIHGESESPILLLLQTLGVQMSELSEAVDAVLASEADEDAQAAAALAAKDQVIADLQSQLNTVTDQLTTALANDAADAQTIADTQAQLDAQAADIQAQIDRLNEAFPSSGTPQTPPDETVPPEESGPVGEQPPLPPVDTQTGVPPGGEASPPDESSGSGG